MISNVNRTFTTTPLLVISEHLLNIFVLVEILTDGDEIRDPEDLAISTDFKSQRLE